MDCAQMRQWVLDGGDIASPEARLHREECPACQALFAEAGDLPSLLDELATTRTSAPLPSFEAIQADIAREPAWRARLATLSSTWRWPLAGLALLVPVLLGLLRHRHNLDAYPLARLALEVGALGALALAACWLWLRPLYKRQPSHRTMLAVLALSLALPWVVASLPPALAEAPAMAPGAPGALHRALSCFGYGTMTAAPVLIIVVGFGRRSGGFPGFALLPAVASALAGIIGLELHCPDASPSHLLAGHAPIVLALPLLLLLASRFRRGKPATV
jgi:predicted anti-sigma-YlaC factor YlaD